MIDTLPLTLSDTTGNGSTSNTGGEHLSVITGHKDKESMS